MTAPTRPVLRALALLSVLPLVLTGCFASTEDETQDAATDRVRLALNNTSSSLAAVIAEEQGFFADHGLDVESTVLADITRIPPALGNQFDIGFGVQPLIIRGASEGLDTVVVSGNGLTSAESPDMVLMSRGDSGIETAADMEGVRLGAPTLTGNLHLGVLYWLQEEGVDPESVDSVQVATPAMLDQLDQGQIDVAEVQQPFITLAREEGMVEIDYPLTAVNDPVGMSSWISSGDWAEDNEDVVTRFRSALDDAAAWMDENESDAKATLAEFTGQDAELVENAPLGRYTTEVGVEDLRVWDQVLRDVAGFTGEVDYDSLVAYPTVS